MVGTGHSGQRRAVTAVTVEYVLQDFFTALVLEIDIDIRGLIALARQKTLEQQVAAHRVQLGDAQHETHHRVGRRATALTENALAAGKLDDVVNGKEIALVVQLGNQLKFVFQRLTGFLFETVGPAPALPLFAQVAQPGAGRLPGGHQLAGVLVAQLAQVETAAGGNAQGFIEQRLRIQLGQLRQRAQVTLAVGEQALPGLGHGAVMTDRRHAVLQGTPPSGMHVHVARRYSGKFQGPGQGQQLLQTQPIVGATVQLDRQPQALGEAFTQPVADSQVLLAFIRHPQGQQSLQRGIEVFTQQLVGALLRPSPAQGDKPAQVLVTGQIFRQ
ncbi:hypothetical protein D3C81_733180 [compost metagenome]